MVRDYKVSPFWLLSGEGDVLLPGWTFEKVKSVQKTCKLKEDDT